MRTIAIIAGAASLWLAAIAPAMAADTMADIKLFQYKPKMLEVKAGTTVTWTNGDAIEHSVTAGAPGKETSAFDSGFFNKGASWSHTFSEPGTYTYFCKRHNSMKAAITVTE
jgi:plastocyanin